MFTIAKALDNGNPFAYLLIIVILCPPIVIILFEIIDKIKRRIKDD